MSYNGHGSDRNSDSDRGSDGFKILCPLCEKDLTLLSTALRNAHTERCLDSTPPEAPAQPPPASTSSDKMSRCMARLDRLEDCPICGTSWYSVDLARAAHARACAKRYSVSDSDFIGLVDMFCESLDSMSEASSANKVGQSSRAPSKLESEESRRKSSTFLKAFSPQYKTFTSKDGVKSAKAKGKCVSGKTGSALAKKTSLSSWINGHTAADSGESADECDFVSQSSTSARSLSRASSSIMFEIPEDENFQSTKVRVNLKQSRIAVSKKDRRREEFLDEIDDDLNEAKALSLSLKRGPDSSADEYQQAGVKRRSRSAKSTEELTRSDILASKEAQNYIRQRAVALEKMDAGRFGPTHSSGQEIHTGACSTDEDSNAQSPDSRRLWSLGSRAKCASDSDCYEYCPIFDNYNSRHSQHAAIADCVEEMIDHLLRSVTAERMCCPEDDGARKEDVEEAALRSGYMQLLSVARKCFAKQKGLLRCKNWVDANTADCALCADAAGDSDSIVVLSSSGESLDCELPAVSRPLLSVCNKQTTSLPTASLPPPLPKNVQAIPQTEARSSSSVMPNYKRLPLDTLKQMAADYGLRTNTPRRLLEHQLETIWRRTHSLEDGAQLADVDADSGKQLAAEASLRRSLDGFIRSQPELYEQILCYRVLDFETVYQTVSRHVPCHKWMLRRFFDSQGIVYSSYHE
ncbi:5'-flap endonuclease [Coemansia sp. Benny D115]|nr:5'-flap endonuclease [Coemansia sp. Benny D115]